MRMGIAGSAVLAPTGPIRKKRIKDAERKKFLRPTTAVIKCGLAKRSSSFLRFSAGLFSYPMIFPDCGRLAPVLALTCLTAMAAPAGRTNIVFLLADDLGWRDVACYGARDIATPNIDRLAGQGVRFTQFHSNGPECSPTRAAFLSGRYQQRLGGLECAIGVGGVGRYDDAERLAEKGELGFPAGANSIAQLLRDGGYATALVGKWHLGYAEKFSPNRRGFDHAFYCVGGEMDYFAHFENTPERNYSLRLNGEPVLRPGYFTQLIADDAVSWLKARQASAPQKPFFLFVPFTAPHSPFQRPDEGALAPLARDSARWKQGNAPPEVYGAMIHSLDTEIGRILAALDEAGLTQNTLVVFASDNGGTRSARPTGLRGIKGTTFEGGIRVPCIARWPGILPAGKACAYPALTFDLTASFARIAGVNPPAGQPFDGIDILRAVEKNTPPAARSLFWRGRRADFTWRAVREGDWKYVSHQQKGTVQEWLFNVVADSAEQNDLLAQQPETVARLKKQLVAWEGEVRPTR
jgi:N-acetylgalactosamine-6-sulfatase